MSRFIPGASPEGRVEEFETVFPGELLAEWQEPEVTMVLHECKITDSKRKVINHQIYSFEVPFCPYCENGNKH